MPDNEYGHLNDRELLVKVATDQEHMGAQLEKQNGTLAILQKEHNQVSGAVGFMRWVIVALIAAAGVIGGFVWQGDENLPAIAIQQVQCDPSGQNCEVLLP